MFTLPFSLSLSKWRMNVRAACVADDVTVSMPMPKALTHRCARPIRVFTVWHNDALTAHRLQASCY